MKITPEQFAGMTLEDAAAGVARGDFAPEDLAAAARARMDAFEPKINAVITRDDNAASRGPGPLQGLPIAVKDSLMTRGVLTTCGSRILDNFIPPYDAAVVEKLYAAGAYVNAKTNMDEFAMGATGENSAFGATRNPWDLSRIPGGSSSGSAALVAYGGALAALGSDTGGSIRQPAEFCGLVGMKPTYGRVSRWGAGALASSLDQVGPMTRSVRDNALLLDIIDGYDNRDSTSARQADDAASCLPSIEDGIKGLRIGIDPSLTERDGFVPEVAITLNKAIDLAKAGGAEIKEVKIPLIDYGVAAYYIICCCEASANMARFDGVRYGKRQGDGDLWEIYCETRGKGFGDEVKRRIMMGSYALSQGYYDAYYLKAARVRRLFTSEMTKLFEGVDAIMMPVSPTPPRLLGAKASVLENYLGDVFTLPANLTGLPSLTYPVELHNGLPDGVQVLGAPFREDILYRVARDAEKSVSLTGAPWTKAQPQEVK